MRGRAGIGSWEAIDASIMQEAIHETHQTSRSDHSSGADAEPRYKRSLDIREKVPGPGHPSFP
jgi:hypothetical protein